MQLKKFNNKPIAILFVSTLCIAVAEAETTENFNLNSKQLGYDSPVVIGTSYSKDLGLIIGGRYGHLFSDDTAISVELEAGSRNYRLNSTLGHAFSDTDRAKITIDALRQKQKYTFRSGDTDEWINQNGLGVEYEHLNPDKLLSDFHVGATFVKSDSKNLADKTFLTESDTLFEVFNNERHIAGATSKDIVVGVGISPRPSTRLKLDLHYDDIKYDTTLAGASNNLKGGGIGFGWTEQLSNKTSLDFSASSREPYDQYRAKVSHRLGKKIMGQNATLQVSAAHQAGKHGLDDDNRATVSFAFGGGGSNSLSSSYKQKANTSSSSAQSDLLAWTSKPAVHESRVLARADQKAIDERLAVASKSDLAAANATLDAKGELRLANVTGVGINQVTKNGVAIQVNSDEFRIEGGVLIIGLAKLEAPATYFISVEEADGQFTHISFGTFQGSIGLEFLEVTPDQSSPDQNKVEDEPAPEAPIFPFDCIDASGGADSGNNAAIGFLGEGCGFVSEVNASAADVFALFSGLDITANGENIDIVAVGAVAIINGGGVNLVAGSHVVKAAFFGEAFVTFEFDAVVVGGVVTISNVRVIAAEVIDEV